MNGRELATLLMHIHKHQGEPIDMVALGKLLPPEADYSHIERRLVEEHLIIRDSRVWRPTPKGRLYAEVLLTFRHNKLYMVICLIFCLGLLSFLALRIIV
ncbi:MAG: hypothetical protein ACE5KU_00960 [Nitrososphaerales archaeon]